MFSLDQRIGQNLRRLRRKAGLSQLDLANSLKISVTDIRRFEAGEKRVGPRRLWQLSGRLDCPLSAFFAAETPARPRTGPRQAWRGLQQRIRAEALAMAQAHYALDDYRRRAAGGALPS